MWFLSHNRHAQVATISKASIALCIFACAGCTQLPKFQSESRPVAPNLVTQSDQEIPRPIFANAPEASEERVPRVASTFGSRGLIAETKPFAWEELDQSAGKRSIEGVTVGHGGYRSLILGSLAGDDPLAIQLTEDLAQHIHRNSIILGGIVATVIRNSNPDGQAIYRMENANGVYLNRQFPVSSDISRDLLKREPEVRFILGVLEKRQPQRVIHIRTCSGERGKIAASSGATQVAKDACQWLDFEFLPLPGNSADGTLERYLSSSQTCEVITFAIPQTTPKSQLWETYGDSLLNLLLDEDFETRKLARTQKAREFADRRTKNANKSVGDDDD